RRDRRVGNPPPQNSYAILFGVFAFVMLVETLKHCYFAATVCPLVEHFQLLRVGRRRALWLVDGATPDLENDCAIRPYWRLPQERCEFAPRSHPELDETRSSAPRDCRSLPPDRRTA